MEYFGLNDGLTRSHPVTNVTVSSIQSTTQSPCFVWDSDSDARTYCVT